uniref:Transmembrane protein n=1 Tax=Chromera velia CCMP2878 TaxID=1169474 RepID=A0A0G4HZH4_9ALVE|eukprot:Cvel_9715.t1-p1 / transcript=Cvel_9715.t1 / gene=Cvel_9715 / organism=Chromera_velia_CCMP2878 / gene_product=hypothetical protein / transcript_product=hypothetical protein / location=Cvel_scaffold567:19850-38114(-) / protein_length=1549 / sequence_SO=supercontig / SO=protein_coding / is_pseudo=false
MNSDIGYRTAPGGDFDTSSRNHSSLLGSPKRRGPSPSHKQWSGVSGYGRFEDPDSSRSTKCSACSYFALSALAFVACLTALVCVYMMRATTSKAARSLPILHHDMNPGTGDEQHRTPILTDLRTSMKSNKAESSNGLPSSSLRTSSSAQKLSSVPVHEFSLKSRRGNLRGEAEREQHGQQGANTKETGKNVPPPVFDLAAMVKGRETPDISQLVSLLKRSCPPSSASSGSNGAGVPFSHTALDLRGKTEDEDDVHAGWRQLDPLMALFESGWGGMILDEDGRRLQRESRSLPSKVLTVSSEDALRQGGEGGDSGLTSENIPELVQKHTQTTKQTQEQGAGGGEATGNDSDGLSVPLLPPGDQLDVLRVALGRTDCQVVASVLGRGKVEGEGENWGGMRDSASGSGAGIGTENETEGGGLMPSMSPKIVVLEVNEKFPPSAMFAAVESGDGNFQASKRGALYGCSLSYQDALMKSLGYRLLFLVLNQAVYLREDLLKRGCLKGPTAPPALSVGEWDRIGFLQHSLRKELFSSDALLSDWRSETVPSDRIVDFLVEDLNRRSPRDFGMQQPASFLLGTSVYTMRRFDADPGGVVPAKFTLRERKQEGGKVKGEVGEEKVEDVKDTNGKPNEEVSPEAAGKETETSVQQNQIMSIGHQSEALSGQQVVIPQVPPSPPAETPNRVDSLSGVGKEKEGGLQEGHSALPAKISREDLQQEVTGVPLDKSVSDAMKTKAHENPSRESEPPSTETNGSTDKEIKAEFQNNSPNVVSSVEEAQKIPHEAPTPEKASAPSAPSANNSELKFPSLPQSPKSDSSPDTDRAKEAVATEEAQESPERGTAETKTGQEGQKSLNPVTSSSQETGPQSPSLEPSLTERPNSAHESLSASGIESSEASQDPSRTAVASISQKEETHPEGGLGLKEGEKTLSEASAGGMESSRCRTPANELAGRPGKGVVQPPITHLELSTLVCDQLEPYKPTRRLLHPPEKDLVIRRAKGAVGPNGQPHEDIWTPAPPITGRPGVKPSPVLMSTPGLLEHQVHTPSPPPRKGKVPVRGATPVSNKSSQQTPAGSKGQQPAPFAQVLATQVEGEEAKEEEKAEEEGVEQEGGEAGEGDEDDVSFSSPLFSMSPGGFSRATGPFSLDQQRHDIDASPHKRRVGPSIHGESENWFHGAYPDAPQRHEVGRPRTVTGASRSPQMPADGSGPEYLVPQTVLPRAIRDPNPATVPAGLRPLPKELSAPQLKRAGPIEISESGANKPLSVVDLRSLQTVSGAFIIANDNTDLRVNLSSLREVTEQFFFDTDQLKSLTLGSLQKAGTVRINLDSETVEGSVDFTTLQSVGLLYIEDWTGPALDFTSLETVSSFFITNADTPSLTFSKLVSAGYLGLEDIELLGGAQTVLTFPVLQSLTVARTDDDGLHFDRGFFIDEVNTLEELLFPTLKEATNIEIDDSLDLRLVSANKLESLSLLDIGTGRNETVYDFSALERFNPSTRTFLLNSSSGGTFAFCCLTAFDLFLQVEKECEDAGERCEVIRGLGEKECAAAVEAALAALPSA